MKLLLTGGAKPNGTNALKHMLDRENVEGLRLLLAAGADPNETNDRAETAMHWAVWRGRSPQTIAALIKAGADVDARRKDGRTAYALAVLEGQSEVAAMLADAKADTTLTPTDEFVAACAQAGPAELEKLIASHPQFVVGPGSERLLPDLASVHRVVSVRALLAAGAPVDARGEWGATALHWACWKGYADIVNLLLDHHASLTINDEMFHASPVGWCMHGLHNCDEKKGNYVETVRQLIARGADFAKSDLPTGNSEIDAILRDHGVI
jgi:ankyrin repeat protein